MKYLFYKIFSFSLFFFPIFCFSQEDYGIRKQNIIEEYFKYADIKRNMMLSGIYHAGDPTEGFYLYLLNDSLFVHDYYFYSDYHTEKYPSMLFKTVTGSYIFENNHLVLHPLEYFKQYMYIEDTVPFLMEKDNYFATNAVEIKTDFRLVLYDGHYTLLSDQRIGKLDKTSDFLDFCNDVNSGDFANRSTSYFVKTEGFSKKKTFNKTDLPPHWQDYILDTPIELIFTGLTEKYEADTIFAYQLNAYVFETKDTQLKEGMLIHGQQSDCVIRIVKILKDKVLGVPMGGCVCVPGEIVRKSRN